ncbi:hypothetical protein C6A85_00795, partial [Mycobacterium sp. ITM-2017-0098]
AAAFVHLVRYALLIINRTMLLNPWLAAAPNTAMVAISVIRTALADGPRRSTGFSAGGAKCSVRPQRG